MPANKVAAMVELEKSVFSNHHNYAFSKETSIDAKTSGWYSVRNGMLLSKHLPWNANSLQKKKQLDSGKPGKHHLIEWSKLTWPVMGQTELGTAWYNGVQGT